MKTRRVICILVAALLSVGMLAGCNSGNPVETSMNTPAATQPTAPVESSSAEPERIKDPSVDQLLKMSWEEIEEYAKEEGELTFFAWDNEDVYIKMGNAFKAKYGIEVKVVIADHNSGVEKALVEKDGKVGSFDVMKVGGESTKTTIEAGVYAGPILSKMENADKLEPNLCVKQEGVDIGGYLVPVHCNQTGLLYNPRTVTNPPQTWEDLEKWIDANPKKFGFCVPSGGGSGQAFVLSIIKNTTGGLDQYYGDSEVDEAKVEKWSAVWDWINERVDKITLTTSNNDSLSRLNQGELDLIVAWDDNSVRVIKAGELFSDATLYIPKFGMAGGGDTLGLMKNAENFAAGLLFINWMTSNEGQQMLMDEMSAYPARVDMAVKDTLINPADLVNKLMWIPAAYKARFISDFTQYVLMK